jgi:hypothetical protein
LIVVAAIINLKVSPRHRLMAACIAAQCGTSPNLVGRSLASFKRDHIIGAIAPDP